MLLEKLTTDLRQAMRDRDATRVRTLRSVRAALQQREIEKRGKGDEPLTADDVLFVLQKQAKQRMDSISQYADAGRTDLETAEREELEIIEEYLPEQAGDDEIAAVLRRVIEQVDATSVADMGKVMGQAMSVLKGKADGRRINELARQLLST